MRLDEFDYHLPEDLIAQEPLSQRDASRLLVLHRASGALEHQSFSELPRYLRPGDLLVLNDAKVIPARLLGKKVETGGKVELVLTMPLADTNHAVWRCIGQASKAIRPGMQLDFHGLSAQVLHAHGDGSYDVRFDTSDFFVQLNQVGSLPLPPYIRHTPNPTDSERYQTVFARQPGAAAAPTAGLHFTEPLLKRIQAMGVHLEYVTLYVGAGTFLPVRAQEIENHQMHPERYQVPERCVAAVSHAKAQGKRVIAVGTTAARTLESAWTPQGLQPGEGVSRLFIYPGYRFGVVDALLTNFHLPRSTLLMLVSGLAGRQQILDAYAQAVSQRYRFFSYGDAMLIL